MTSYGRSLERWWWWWGVCVCVWLWQIDGRVIGRVVGSTKVGKMSRYCKYDDCTVPRYCTNFVGTIFVGTVLEILLYVCNA